MGSRRWVSRTVSEKTLYFASHRYNPFSTDRLTLELRRSRLFDYYPVRAVLRILSPSVSRLLSDASSCSVLLCVLGPWVFRVLLCEKVPHPRVIGQSLYIIIRFGQITSSGVVSAICPLTWVQLSKHVLLLTLPYSYKHIPLLTVSFS